MTNYKFNIKGAYGETNFGDDLLMLVFEKFFLKEFPDSTLNFEGEKSNYPQQLLKKGTYNENKQFDWLVFGGGTQFFAFQENFNSSIYDKIKLGISNPKLILNKFRSNKKKFEYKTAFLGFGLGPFNNNQKIINYAKDELSNASFIGVRDEVSYNYCNDWGINSFLGADVVFSSYFNDIELDTKSVNDKKKIGIIVRDWEFENSGASYLSELKRYYKLYETEYDINIIVFAPLKDKKCIELFKNENVLIWNPKKDSISSFLNKLNNFDLLISARYHGAIIGTLLNKPVICVEIEPKLRILTEQVKEILLWEKPFRIEHLEKLVKKIDFKGLDYTRSLSERKELANSMLNEFKDSLKCNK